MAAPPAPPVPFPCSLEGALDRFAQFFIAPLLNPNGAAREVNAVNNEHTKNLQVPDPTANVCLADRPECTRHSNSRSGPRTDPSGHKPVHPAAVRRGCAL